MHVAERELCEELYELSGWKDTHNTWKRLMTLEVTGWRDWYLADFNNAIWDGFGEQSIPAYDLGYLLRKLPKTVRRLKHDHVLVLTNSTTDGSWVADYLMANWQYPLPEHGMDVWFHSGDRAKLTEAIEVEDAVAKLCIALIKQGVINPKQEKP